MMSMSKKHFEALAAVLKIKKPTINDCEVHRDACEGVADVCARFNPNFDRTRFLKACGVEEGNNG